MLRKRDSNPPRFGTFQNGNFHRTENVGFFGAKPDLSGGKPHFSKKKPHFSGKGRTFVGKKLDFSGKKVDSSGKKSDISGQKSDSPEQNGILEFRVKGSGTGTGKVFLRRRI